MDNTRPGVKIMTAKQVGKTEHPGARFWVLCLNHQQAVPTDTRREAAEESLRPHTWCGFCARDND